MTGAVLHEICAEAETFAPRPRFDGRGDLARAPARHDRSKPVRESL